MTEQDRINRRIVSRRYWRRYKHVMPDRTEYMKKYYQANREKKLAAANARHAHKRFIRENGAPVRMEIVD